jgi:hypothetical protein
MNSPTAHVLLQDIAKPLATASHGPVLTCQYVCSLIGARIGGRMPSPAMGGANNDHALAHTRGSSALSLVPNMAKSP